MEAEPVILDSKLGAFTHFANVLDLNGISLPVAEYQDGITGETLPLSITLLGACGLTVRSLISLGI